MFYRLRMALMRFMAGRYGGDQLNNALFVTYLVLWCVGLFVRQGVAALILSALGMLVVVLILFRTLSRNIPRRQMENDRFNRLWWPVKSWFKRQFIRLRDIRRYRYRGCPYCHAQLRLPVRRGKRTVTCSRCQSQFKSFFL